MHFGLLIVDAKALARPFQGISPKHSRDLEAISGVVNCLKFFKRNHWGITCLSGRIFEDEKEDIAYQTNMLYLFPELDNVIVPYEDGLFWLKNTRKFSFINGKFDHDAAIFKQIAHSMRITSNVWIISSNESASYQALNAGFNHMEATVWRMCFNLQKPAKFLQSTFNLI